MFTLLLLSPLGKGHGPSFEETWIYFTQGCFVPTAKFVWNWPPGFEGEEEYVKSLQQDDDNGQRTNCDQKSSFKPLAQVS